MANKHCHKISISHNNEPVEFEAHSPSILHTLESKNIDLPYQCREGFCGACRIKLINGEVKYNQEPLAFIRQGEILACCSKPIGDIEITLLD